MDYFCMSGGTEKSSLNLYGFLMSAKKSIFAKSVNFFLNVFDRKITYFL